MSLRRRVLIGVFAVIAVLIITNVALASTFEGYLVNRVDEQLTGFTSRAPALRQLPTPPSGGVSAVDQPTVGGGPFTDLFFGVVGDGTVTRIGSALSGSPDAPDITGARAIEAVGRAAFTVSGTDGGSWRVVASQRDEGDVFVVGLNLNELNASVNRMRVIQVAGTTAVLAALALMSWWVLRQGVRPIDAMARTADAIAAGDLSHRVENPDTRTEAGRLGGAMNSMLDTIEMAFHLRAESEESVRRFAADASHELRTPLTSIRGYLELWEAGGLRGEGEFPEALRRVRQEATRMGALVEDLLLLARLDQRAIEHAPVRVDQLAKDAVRDARVVEPSRLIKLRTERAIVVGDEMRLRQVFANLLGNVRVHTPPTTAVDVHVYNKGSVVRVEVSDDGPGIEPNAVDQIFERFYRPEESRSRTTGGSGLGLAIVAAIAEAHGGSATVTSTLGTGSRFVVDLASDP